MLQKLKSWGTVVISGLVFVFGLGLLIFRNRLNIAEALLSNDEIKEKLRVENSAIDKNNALLQEEEEKRKEIENAPANSDNLIDILSRRK